jgi:hypothetical protein
MINFFLQYPALSFVFAFRLVSGCAHVFLAAAAVSKANKSAEPASLPVALLDVLFERNNQFLCRFSLCCSFFCRGTCTLGTGFLIRGPALSFFCRMLSGFFMSTGVPAQYCT